MPTGKAPIRRRDKSDGSSAGSNPAVPNYKGERIMVAIAQLVEHQIVYLRVVGSNPSSYPTSLGSRQAVRHQALDLTFAGSNPASPTISKDNNET